MIYAHLNKGKLYLDQKRSLLLSYTFLKKMKDNWIEKIQNQILRNVTLIYYLRGKKRWLQKYSENYIKW